MEIQPVPTCFGGDDAADTAELNDGGDETSDEGEASHLDAWILLGTVVLVAVTAMVIATLRFGLTAQLALPAAAIGELAAFGAGFVAGLAGWTRTRSCLWGIGAGFLVLARLLLWI